MRTQAIFNSREIFFALFFCLQKKFINTRFYIFLLAKNCNPHSWQEKKPSIVKGCCWKSVLAAHIWPDVSQASHLFSSSLLVHGGCLCNMQRTEILKRLLLPATSSYTNSVWAELQAKHKLIVHSECVCGAILPRSESLLIWLWRSKPAYPVDAAACLFIMLTSLSNSNWHWNTRLSFQEQSQLPR